MPITIRLGARLRAARKAAGFKTSKDFLKKHKVAASTYSQHESGARLPDDEMLKFYSNVFEVNFSWLKSGYGKPYSRISATKRNIMSEELIQLKKTKNIHPINDVLLTSILENLLQKHCPTSVKNIVKKAVKQYIKQAYLHD